MNNYIKSELRRALFSKKAMISFIIAFIALIIPLYLFCYIGGISFIGLHFDAVDVFARIRSTSEGALLVVIFPLLASIIFSDSYTVEKESGFTKFIYSRMSVKSYVWIKVISNAISSMVVGIMASGTMFIFLICILGIRTTDGLVVDGPFSSIYYSNKLLYGIIMVLITGICYAVISELSLGISAWIKNRYLVLIIPFFGYILCGTLIEELGINRVFNFNFSQVYALNIIVTTTHEILYPLMLLLIGIGLFYLGVVKREKDM